MLGWRVWTYGDPENLRLDEIEDNLAGPGEIVVDTRAASVNFPDLLVVAGKYRRRPSLPFIPGKDLTGVVRMVGPGVTGFAVGDRVLALVEHGAFAEQVVVPATKAYVLPREMPFATAAAMGLTYQTAYLALIERAGYQPGETVLVGGATGGVGLAALQIAKAMGAHVLATVRSDEQAAWARDNGADALIDLAQPDLRESLRDQVHAVTNGCGADIVLDPLGGAFFAAALRAMAWCGRLVVIGFAAGHIPTLKVNYLLLKNISVGGLQWSDYRNRSPALVRQAQDKLFDLWRDGLLRPLITASFPLSELPAALARIAAGDLRGKVVIIFDGASP